MIDLDKLTELAFKMYKLKVDSGTAEYEYGNGVALDVGKTMNEAIKEAKLFLYKIDKFQNEVTND